MSEISKLFEGLPKRFQKENVKEARTYYFSLDEDEKWTVSISPKGCSVEEGKRDADCFFKGSKKMFLEVWSGMYTPTVTDFLTGAIKSNNPLMLKDFVAAFQKKK
jgi:putative sterol carrier protein